MKVLILTDDAFARRERSMLARLEIGLANEGVRLVHAIPESAGSLLGAEVFNTALVYPEAPALTPASWRARQMLTALHESAGGGDVDLVHVFGGSVWSMGLAIGKHCDAPVVLEVWRPGLLDRLAKRRTDPVLGPVCVAPSEGMRGEVDRVAAHLPAFTIEWGVRVPTVDRAEVEPGRMLGVVLCASGRDGTACRAALGGVFEAIGDREAMVFVDARAGRRAGLWGQAKSNGWLDRVSFVEELEERRELTVRADVLVQPECQGEQRTVLLDAMAHEVRVVARRDETVSWLVDQETALLVDSGHAADWARALRPVLRHPNEGREILARAKAYVKSGHGVARQVQRVYSMYEQLRGEPVHRFEGAGR